MYCPHCGTENHNGSQYCRHCGAFVASAAAGMPYGAPQQPYGSGSAPENGAASAQQPYGQAPYGQPPYEQRPVSAEGCVTRAWRDVTGTKGWFGKTCLLGLIGAVPILNWVVMGYTLRWSRQLVLGAHTPMPDRIFADRTFVTGFYMAVLALVIAIVSGFVSAFVGWVPLFGLIVALAFSLFIGAFSCAMALRMAIVDRFGAAFSLGRVWAAAKRSFGSLFCAAYAPALVGAIAFVVLGVAYAIVIGIVAGPAIGAAASALYAQTHHDAVTLTINLGAGEGTLSAMAAAVLGPGATIGSIAATLIAWVAGAMIATAAQLVIFRAVGYWAARVAPEWAAEAPERPSAAPWQQPPTGQAPFQR